MVQYSYVDSALIRRRDRLIWPSFFPTTNLSFELLNNTQYIIMHVDYSVYLVTDNTPAILGDQDLVEVVRAAVEGGPRTQSYHNYHYF